MKDFNLTPQQPVSEEKKMAAFKKLVEKGYIKRDEPGFMCSSLISKDEVCKSETKSLVDRLFGGSKKALFCALLEDEDLTREELDAIREMIEKR